MKKIKPDEDYVLIEKRIFFPLMAGIEKAGQTTGAAIAMENLQVHRGSAIHIEEESEKKNEEKIKK